LQGVSLRRIQTANAWILDGINPIMERFDSPRARTEEDTTLNSLSEIKAMLAMLDEPARRLYLQPR